MIGRFKPLFRALTSLFFFSQLPISAGFIQEQTPTFKGSVKVVDLLAVVHDSGGHLRRDLTKDDFLLEVDGHPQPLKYFSSQPDLPLIVGLLLDTSESMQMAVYAEARTGREFFKNTLGGEGDRAFVVAFSKDVELIQPLTSSQALLNAALRRVHAPHVFNLNQAHGGQERETALYDALAVTSLHIMKLQRGRKAIVVLSDGVDVGSAVHLSGAIAAAQQTDTAIYSIQFSFLWDDFPWMDGVRLGITRREMIEMELRADKPLRRGRAVLQMISEKTGGGFFEAGKGSIDTVYKAISKELRNQYSLGFEVTPEVSAKPGVHKISLSVNRPGFQVESRKSFYVN